MKNYKFKINGNEYNVDVHQFEGQDIQLSVNGTEYNVTLDQEIKPKRPTIVTNRTPRVSPANGDVQRSVAASKTPQKVAGNKVCTPLPGTILDVFVNVGDTVKAGQCVVLLEAMKMENNIEADCDGTVTAVNVRKGDNVLEGDALVVIG